MTVAYGINVVGNLTNNQGILSGFSSGNYAELPFDFCPAKTPYEIVLKFNCSNVSGDQILLLVGDWREPYGMIDIQLTNNKICAEINATDTMGNATTILSANTDYWVKLTYDGVSEYNLYLSTNGISFNLEDTLQSSLYLNSNNPMPSWIGINDDKDTYYLNGSIDLNESYIKLNGSYVWKGVASISNVGTRIQLRHDTAANWTSVNPVLLEGEVGIETDTLKQKVGDGVTAWNSLSYQNEIFIAEYGVTSFSDIVSAYNNSKTIICKATVPSEEVESGELFATLQIVGIDANDINDFVFDASWGRRYFSISIDYENNWEIGNGYLQKLLESGTNIKTINNTSILGSGNVAVQPTLVSGTNIKTVNNTSLLGSGNIDTSEIFVAEYNVTPFADIKTAYDAGKTILCKGNGYQSNAIGVMYRLYILSQGDIGECTFYSALGTVIFTATAKLTRGTTTWESGFSELSSYDLSNVSSIDANSAVQTALDAKVNKSGDTMTGELNITNASGLTIINDAVTKGTAPSSTTWRHLQFVDSANSSGDWGVSRLGILEQSINDNGSTSVFLSTIQNVANSTNRATLTLTMTSAGVGSCTFPNTTCVDGQWIASYQEAIGSSAQTINGQTTKDITFSNLPAKNCEVIFTVSQSTDYELGIYSSIISGGTLNRAMKKGCATFIMPVSSDKKVKIYNINSNTASINFVRMFGYRILGTNATP